MPVESIESVALPAITVSDVEIRQQSVSFDVDQIGVPVLVRVSYFPNWQVEGAEGPYRVSPNHMVVVPTETSVELTYGRSGLDWFFYGLTALGIAFCVFLRRQGDLEYASEVPRFGTPDPTDEPMPVNEIGEPLDPTPIYLGEPLAEPDDGFAPPGDVGAGESDIGHDDVPAPGDSGPAHR